MFNLALNSKDVERLMASDYLNYEVLIQIKKEINDHYDGLEKKSLKGLADPNKMFSISYKTINESIYNIKKNKNDSLTGDNILGMEQETTAYVNKIDVIIKSKKEFNEKIDKLIDLKAPK